ncbi:unnamed protein product [Spirodela intermedia]|uniref:Uncharacterized protein n=1 Tax=Spirodela intermedia TaxID=51605 RepID=A0A7I8KUY9_SPIIN|nr:unnamed protein product [Spirodela intermedia]
MSPPWHGLDITWMVACAIERREHNENKLLETNAREFESNLTMYEQEKTSTISELPRSLTAPKVALHVESTCFVIDNYLP